MFHHFANGAQRWRGPPSRRAFATTTKDALRALLRETGQPVAVVTSLLPVDGDDGQSSSLRRFHGATLSSFSSIALDPHPLIAFSLKFPSRMANSLKALTSDAAPSENPSMVLNLLSSGQARTAAVFAHPDLHPEPFKSTEYTLSQDGLPILSGSLGALSCSVLECIPLHTLCESADEQASTSGPVSELFISRVQRGGRSVERFAAPSIPPSEVYDH